MHDDRKAAQDRIARFLAERAVPLSLRPFRIVTLRLER
jgi:hypothetical protein